MSECTIAAYLLLGISNETPTPGKPEVLSKMVVSTKLKCSMADGHPGNEHQAYYGDKLFTWLYPDPTIQDVPVALGDTERAEGS